jgi:hypothetical protein
MLDLPSSTPSSSARRAGLAPGLDPLVVVVDRNRQRLLGVILADHIAVEELADLVRLGQFLQQADLCALGEFLLDDLVTEINALVRRCRRRGRR